MFALGLVRGDGEDLLIRSKHIPSLRPPQHLHTHVFVRDPGMRALPCQTVQEIREVVRSLEIETLHVDGAAVRVEQLAEWALHILVGVLGRELGDLVDDFLLRVSFLGFDDEREVYRGLVGLVDDFERYLVVLLTYGPE